MVCISSFCCAEKPVTRYPCKGRVFWQSRSDSGRLLFFPRTYNGNPWYVEDVLYSTKNELNVDFQLASEEFLHRNSQVLTPWQKVSNSILPFLLAFNIFGFMVQFVYWLHHGKFFVTLPFIPIVWMQDLPILISVFGILFVVLEWYFMIREETLEGEVSFFENEGFALGLGAFLWMNFWLFLVFFWAFFNAALTPTVELGALWPQKGLGEINALRWPLEITCLGVLSSLLLTQAHVCLREDSVTAWRVSTASPKVVKNLKFPEITRTLETFLAFIIVAAFFVCSIFRFLLTLNTLHINDGMYGTTLFIIVGMVCVYSVIVYVLWLGAWLRLELDFERYQYWGFQSLVWVWHFVIAAWIVTYLFIICWGSAYGSSTIWPVTEDSFQFTKELRDFLAELYGRVDPS